MALGPIKFWVKDSFDALRVELVTLKTLIEGQNPKAPAMKREAEEDCSR